MADSPGINDLPAWFSELRRKDAEIAQLRPYVEAFRREEDRADKAERRIDDLEGALASIRDAKEPKDDRADDDADWRFCALEMKRVAEVALRNGKRS